MWFLRLMYNHLVGGVLALSKEQFTKVNGWSNLYWGWGVSQVLYFVGMFISFFYRQKMMVKRNTGLIDCYLFFILDMAERFVSFRN
jgi:hypothetical protein